MAKLGANQLRRRLPQIVDDIIMVAAFFQPHLQRGAQREAAAHLLSSERIQSAARHASRNYNGCNLRKVSKSVTGSNFISGKDAS